MMTLMTCTKLYLSHFEDDVRDVYPPASAHVDAGASDGYNSPYIVLQILAQRPCQIMHPQHTNLTERRKSSNASKQLNKIHIRCYVQKSLRVYGRWSQGVDGCGEGNFLGGAGNAK